jgi:transcriptional regulator with XRE-family HTH domain
MRAHARLRQWREHEKLTQTELAEQVRCSQSVLSKIERGVLTPNGPVQRAIFALTGIAPNDWILAPAEGSVSEAPPEDPQQEHAA